MNIDWLEALLGRAPGQPVLFETALTHGSTGAADYQRLEFLGDRVLGLAMAEFLYERFPQEPEGSLSKRLNALVSGETCAAVARDVSLGPHIRLGKQARDDGAADSDNVLGDVMEALIGALFLDAGLDPARALVRRLWEARIDSVHAPQHPKSQLQEWAAANRRKPPEYVLEDHKGPPHNPRFRVRVSIGNVGEATGEGGSKQEAERAAAAALLATLT
jgi:ribonuclease-3